MNARSMPEPDIAEWIKGNAPAAQLASDSRRISHGDLFIAYLGDEIDGRAFIADAIGRGARAVVYEATDYVWSEAWDVPHLAVTNLKQQVGELAARYYGQPSRALFTVAVTGTNGKTSCTQWLGTALSLTGRPTVVIGTLGVGIVKKGKAGVFVPTGYTTPDAIMLQRELVKAASAGASAVAIEASSIGLDQGRLCGMKIDVAVFTNFTRDHLDYHGEMSAYEEAKSRLFDWPDLRHAIINLDEAMGDRLVQRIKERNRDTTIIGYTLSDKKQDGIATLRAGTIRHSQAGSVFQLESAFGSAQVKTQLLGKFNVCNVLAVIGCLLANGTPWNDAIKAVESLTAVPGRMQQLGGHDTPLMVIDYAHTPDAIEKALSALRNVADDRGGELWCVFGCGGNRDAGKRPYMAQAADAADHVVITTDNPRDEEPASIIEQTIAGLDCAGQKPYVIEDRAMAILWATQRAARQDVILIAGKGHESYQEVKGRKLPFLDADHATLALSARMTKGLR